MCKQGMELEFCFEHWTRAARTCHHFRPLVGVLQEKEDPDQQQHLLQMLRKRGPCEDGDGVLDFRITTSCFCMYAYVTFPLQI